jgi:predicted nuclease of predicted toxin-antitoxin system
MKILADENIPQDAVKYWKERGLEVIPVAIEYAGASDSRIIEIANSHEALIITCDRDFGALIFQEGLHPVMGIIYLRLSTMNPLLLAKTIESLLTSSSFKFENFMTVVEDNFVRQRNFK